MTDDRHELAGARLRHPSARHAARDAPPGPSTPPEPAGTLLGPLSASPIDWPAARAAWEAGDASARELARRLDVSPSTVTRRAARERWQRPTVVELHPAPPAQHPPAPDRATEHPPDPNTGEELRARWAAARARIAARDEQAAADAFPGPLVAGW